MPISKKPLLTDESKISDYEIESLISRGGSSSSEVQPNAKNLIPILLI